MRNDLNDIARRIEKLEKAVFGTGKVKVVKSKTSSRNNSLTNHIVALRDASFFKQPKTAPEVHAKLQQNYPCEPNRVAVALFRLHKNKGLRITSKKIGKKKLQAYVW